MAEPMNSELSRRDIETKTLALVEVLLLDQSMGEVARHFQGYVEDIGFAGAACIKVPEVGDEPADCVLMSTLPEAWLRRYVDANYLKRDPLLKELMRTYEPFSWSELLMRRVIEKPDREVFEEAARHGMTDGFVVPIYESGGYTGFVGMAGRPVHIARDTRSPVVAACVYLHSKLCLLRRRQNDQVFDLTSRELDCLRWAAVGKSDWEIGQILLISAKTVNYHIENAKRKFGVATRVQAIVAAMRSGKLID